MPAAIAIVVHLLALRNGWAGDDMIVVRDNPATKSVAAAASVWFESYWPDGFRWAGLYRPFTILERERERAIPSISRAVATTLGTTIRCSNRLSYNRHKRSWRDSNPQPTE